MTNCYLHKHRGMDDECQYCHAPICGECHHTYQDRVICPDCIRRFVTNDNQDAINARIRLFTELKRMGLLFLIGVAILIYTSFLNRPLLIIGMLAPFILPCLITILRMLAVVWKTLDRGQTNIRNVGRILTDESAGTGFMIKFVFFAFMLSIILTFSPIILLVRVIRRWLDLRKFNKIIAENNAVLGDIREYTEHARHEEVSSAEILESGDNDEEVHIDLSGMANYLASDNGEIIRKIERRII